jgi:hypothetical protein
MISGAQWFMRLRGLERDPEKGLKNMLESLASSGSRFPQSMMPIEFGFASASAM